jgi:glycosyltransferase involved in cell wall biosynthesis
MSEFKVPIFINGRFLGQRLAGVQRYATEMSRALMSLHPEQISILAPRNAPAAGLGERRVGRLTGQLWEQFELPWYARDGFLVNLGNTAPVLKRSQAVVIHDAGVFSTPEAYSRRFRLWYKTLHHYLARNGSTIVTVTDFSKSELVRNLRVSGAKIHVAGEGIDHMNMIDSKPVILALKGLVARRYVLVVGTLAAHKNISALGILSDRLAEAGFTLAVTGAFGASAFNSNGASALPASANYLGRVDDGELKALYENAACFLFPSRYEGFGLPPLEAMACGCAVIASDIPVLRETCGDAAHFCDTRSPMKIADAVCGLLSDAQRLSAMRSAAEERALCFNWNAAAKELSKRLPPLTGNLT